MSTKPRSPHAKAAAQIRSALKKAGIRADVHSEFDHSPVSGGAYITITLLDPCDKDPLTVDPLELCRQVRQICEPYKHLARSIQVNPGIG